MFAMSFLDNPRRSDRWDKLLKTQQENSTVNSELAYLCSKNIRYILQVEKQLFLIYWVLYCMSQREDENSVMARMTYLTRPSLHLSVRPFKLLTFSTNRIAWSCLHGNHVFFPRLLNPSSLSKSVFFRSFKVNTLHSGPAIVRLTGLRWKNWKISKTWLIVWCSYYKAAKRQILWW